MGFEGNTEGTVEACHEAASCAAEGRNPDPTRRQNDKRTS